MKIMSTGYGNLRGNSTTGKGKAQNGTPASKVSFGLKAPKVKEIITLSEHLGPHTKKALTINIDLLKDARITEWEATSTSRIIDFQDELDAKFNLDYRGQRTPKERTFVDSIQQEAKDAFTYLQNAVRFALAPETDIKILKQQETDLNEALFNGRFVKTILNNVLS